MMLCTFCEGTEHSPRPHGLLPRLSGMVYPLENCTTCGTRLWDPCDDCAGSGRRLQIAGQCHHCGQSIVYWLNCSACHGAGKHYHPQHTCRPKPVTRTTPLRPGSPSFPQ